MRSTIITSPETAEGTYFYQLMEKPHGRFFQVWSPYYQMAQGNQKYLYQYSQGDRSDLGKPI